MVSDGPRSGAKLEGQLAIGASLFFALAVVGQAVFRSDHSWVREEISQYANGPGGWFQTVAFVVLGLGELALGYGLWKAAAGSTLVRITSLLVAVGGLVDLTSAAFPIDPEGVTTTAGEIHDLAGMVGFFQALVSAVLFTRARSGDLSWQTVRRASLAATVLLVIGFVGIVMGESGGWGGVAQRFMIFVILGWYLVLGRHLVRGPGTTAASAKIKG
ncbi:MAG TPA: DUF998 domain-containing protein [Candidatus Thermoplasmatota archaeon]|nr:DUF998 domain-containing protein [Candidatus Thermoplasmatota archaeon]